MRFITPKCVDGPARVIGLSIFCSDKADRGCVLSRVSYDNDMLYHSQAKRALLAATSLLIFTLIAAPAFAQNSSEKQEREDSSPQADTSPETGANDRLSGDDFHNRRLDYDNQIIVSAAGLKQLDILAGTSIIEGDMLQRNMAGQIGEVLTKIPGVSASGFAPGASRPILRGLAGERVKVLIDGIGAIDASNTSADHAVTIDPLTAERIEVLRGPASLFYGSQAIGGAVNIIDKRIPRRLTDETLHIDAMLGADTASDLREAGASIDAVLGSGFIGHIDGSYRTSNDLSVPGFVLSPALRADLLAEAAEEEADEPEEAAELREAAGLRGVLPNSATETFSANAGLAFFRDGGNLGVSIGLYDTSYGVPGRPGVEHAHGEEGEEGEEEGAEEEGEENVTIDLRQFRADFRSELQLGNGMFERLRLRAGFSDYTHTEFEGAEVGTVFDVSGIEARAELIQADTQSWRGSSGLQYTARDFLAIGEEAFVPPNRTEQFAVFTVQEFGSGPFQVETAARAEFTDVDSVPLGLKRDFTSLSGAVGVVYEADSAFRAGVNLSRVERAPSAEELFSDGPHIATQAFEIGDPKLSKETALGAEIFARGRIGRADLSVAAFYSKFDDFIYEVSTGEEEDGLPVFQYSQDDADYYGIEGEISTSLFDNGRYGIVTDLRASYVRAELQDGTPVPRIPPLNVLTALEFQSTPFDARVEWQWFDDQNRTASFENATDGFSFVNASLTWRPLIDNPNLTLILSGDNLLDKTGRRHASFTKDFVPLAGRNVKVSARFSL